MAVAQVVRSRREEILRIAGRHGVRQIRPFGSAARGEARPDSDVDFLVTREPGRSLLDLVALKHELEDLLGRRVDLLTPAAISPFMRDQILRDAVEL